MSKKSREHISLMQLVLGPAKDLSACLTLSIPVFPFTRPMLNVNALKCIARHRPWLVTSCPPTKSKMNGVTYLLTPVRNNNYNNNNN